MKKISMEGYYRRARVFSHLLLVLTVLLIVIGLYHIFQSWTF
jgi:hypothetical protein